MPYTNDAAKLYRIEPTRKAVIRTMLNGEELRGNVFIHLSSFRPFELADVSELFNDATTFFPLEPETGEVLLVSKERAAAVAANRSEWASDQHPTEGPVPTALLQLILISGQVRLGFIRP